MVRGVLLHVGMDHVVRKSAGIFAANDAVVSLFPPVDAPTIFNLPVVLAIFRAVADDQHSVVERRVRLAVWLRDATLVRLHLRADRVNTNHEWTDFRKRFGHVQLAAAVHATVLLATFAHPVPSGDLR